MSRTAWAQLRPPDWIDPDAFLYMGADPSWTPEKENRRTFTAVGGVCRLCGGPGFYSQDAAGTIRRDDLGDPIFLPGKIDDGSHHVCGTCYAYGLETIVDKSKPLVVRVKDDEPDSGSQGEKATASSAGKLDLSSLLLAVQPVAEPGFVTKAVAGGTVSVPEKYAHLLDGH